MANEWGRAHAQKRGGFQTQISLDTELAERKFQSELTAAQVLPTAPTSADGH